jgi:hypothetical protein
MLLNFDFVVQEIAAAAAAAALALEEHCSSGNSKRLAGFRLPDSHFAEDLVLRRTRWVLAEAKSALAPITCGKRRTFMGLKGGWEAVVANPLAGGTPIPQHYAC